MTKAPERIKAWVTSDGLTKWEAGSLQFPPNTEVEYIRADLVPAVKPLEWIKAGFIHDADWIDTTQTYQIQDGLYWYAAEVDGVDCGSNEAAKAAAQADYERRVREGIDMQPDPVRAAADRLAECIMRSEPWEDIDAALAAYLKARKATP